MVKFRWHRGSLEESLSTQTIINNLDELYSMIKREFPEADKEDIHVKYYTYDDRLHEKTYLVTLIGYGVIGMTNGCFDMNQ